MAVRVLKFREVVVKSVKPPVLQGLVFGGPLVERLQAGWVKSIETMASYGTTPDETDLAEHPEMLGNLRLGDCNLVNDGAHRHFSSHQDVKDLATMRVGYRIENVDRGGCADHLLIIYLNWNMSRRTSGLRAIGTSQSRRCCHWSSGNVLRV